MIKAEQIRARRASLKWTQTELAEKAGVKQQTIVRLEKDDIGPAGSKGINIINVAKALGLDDGTGELLEI